MKDNETLIKVKNVDEIITEFTYITENLKDTLNNLLTELDNKKDVLNKLEKIETIHNELQDFKNLIEEFKKVQDDFTFLMRITNTTIDDFKKEMKDFKEHYDTLKEMIETQISKFNAYVADEYDKMFKDIQKKLYVNINETLKRIKELDAMLTDIYEKDYLNDVRKLKTQQKITNFLLIILITACGFLFYKLNNKIDMVNVTTYYNYKALYNQ